MYELPSSLFAHAPIKNEAMEECCRTHFHWDVSGCVVKSGGELSQVGTQGNAHHFAEILKHA